VIASSQANSMPCSPIHPVVKIYKDAYYVAGDPGTCPNILSYLGLSSFEHLRRRVAENCSTPQVVLEFLARDSSSEVRISLVDNPRVPTHVILHLATDEDADVRFAVAESSNTPIHILQYLLEDPNPFVVNRAQITIDGLG
jgi:hypothetical protein